MRATALTVSCCVSRTGGQGNHFWAVDSLRVLLGAQKSSLEVSRDTTKMDVGCGRKLGSMEARREYQCGSRYHRPAGI